MSNKRDLSQPFYCYWDARYIAAQPFCITSKLTEAEFKQLLEFEELKYWERSEQLKENLSLAQYFEIEETIEEIKQDCLMLALDEQLLNIDAIMEVVDSELEKVGIYNIQPNGRLLPKTKQETQQNRAMFLSR